MLHTVEKKKFWSTLYKRPQTRACK